MRLLDVRRMPPAGGIETLAGEGQGRHGVMSEVAAIAYTIRLITVSDGSWAWISRPDLRDAPETEGRQFRTVSELRDAIKDFPDDARIGIDWRSME